jgi:ABC-type multidrug transport system fused ATPase/permease subunit
VHALSSGEDGKRTTTIFISHRIQTVRRADKIVVVENGVSTGIERRVPIGSELTDRE